MALAAPPQSTAINAGSPEAPISLAPQIPKTERKIPLSVLFPAITFSSAEQVLEQPLLNVPVEELSEHERGRRGELRFAKLGIKLFGDALLRVDVSGWMEAADMRGHDVTFIFKDGMEIYGQSKSDKLNADKDRARIRDELKIVDDPQAVRRAVAERRLMIVNTAANRSDDDVKNSIWKDFSLIQEVHKQPLPIRADAPVVLFEAESTQPAA